MVKRIKEPRKSDTDFFVWADEEVYELAEYSSHTHNFYQNVFARKGPYEYSVRNRTITLNTGDFLIIPPGVAHAPVGGQDPAAFRSLELKFFATERLTAFFDFPENYRVISLKNNECGPFVMLMETVIREYRTRERNHIGVIEGLLTGILIMLDRARNKRLRRTRKTERKSTSLTENRKRNIARFVEVYVHEHYREPIHFGRMAGNLNISLSYFSEIFKEQNAVSPIEFLNTVRLDKAKELMKTSELNFSQIAEAVGYQNVYYFSRIFKEKNRITPSRYRELINENLHRYGAFETI